MDGRRWLTNPHADRWVVVLAGGQGRRVAGLTRDQGGRPAPKQFCDFGSGVTLLDRTLARAGALVPRERILAAVDARHRCWWEPALRALPPGNILVQSRDLGTALGVLGPVVRVVLTAPGAVVLVLPSDHFVEREDVLQVALERAFDEASRGRGRIVLLGIAPDGPDPDYGWVLPVGASAPPPPGAGELCRVDSFIEKPAPPEAARLLSAGALWSSFIFAATANTLLGVFRSIRPRLLRGYLARARAAGWDSVAALDLEGLPAFDFSRDLLGHCTGRLRVLRAPASGWTDLGTPERIAVWRERRAAAALIA